MYWRYYETSTCKCMQQNTPVSKITYIVCPVWVLMVHIHKNHSEADIRMCGSYLESCTKQTEILKMLTNGVILMVCHLNKMTTILA